MSYDDISWFSEKLTNIDLQLTEAAAAAAVAMATNNMAAVFARKMYSTYF